jgi:proteasome lid subunit RPN8/RPN11
MTLYLSAAARQQLITHAEQGYPNEICGILLGKEGGGRRVIRRVISLDNSFEAEERYHRFLITPEDMLTAERLAQQARIDVLGVYHSHPDEEARPSTYDRDHAAWTSWSYIIVSVRNGRVDTLRAWNLRPERDAFDEEMVEEMVEEMEESRGDGRG